MTFFGFNDEGSHSVLIFVSGGSHFAPDFVQNGYPLPPMLISRGMDFQPLFGEYGDVDSTIRRVAGTPSVQQGGTVF